MQVNNLNKTNYYEKVFNQLSHYNHLLEATDSKSRKTDNQHSFSTRQHPTLSRFDNKLYKSIQQETKKNNNIMLHKLIAIHKKKHTLDNDRYEQYKEKERRHRINRSLEMDKEIKKQNEGLARRIVNAKPIVGTHHQWDDHYNQFIKDQKKLSKLIPEAMSMDSEMYTTFTDLYSRGGNRRIGLAHEYLRKPATSLRTQHTEDKPRSVVRDSSIEHDEPQQSDDLMSKDAQSQLKIVRTKRKKSHRKRKSQAAPSLYVVGATGKEDIEKLLDEYK